MVVVIVTHRVVIVVVRAYRLRSNLFLPVMGTLLEKCNNSLSLERTGRRLLGQNSLENLNSIRQLWQKNEVAEGRHMQVR
jgi:hypothetical protein